MWILILTIAGYSSQSGHAVNAVPGFVSRDACMMAATSWVSEYRTTNSSGAPRALCVDSGRR